MKNTYKQFDDLPLTLSVPQVADALGISRAQAYNLARTDGFPKINVGKRMCVPKQAFINWINQQLPQTINQ